MFYEGTLQNGVTESERVMDQVSHRIDCLYLFGKDRSWVLLATSKAIAGTLKTIAGITLTLAAPR